MTDVLIDLAHLTGTTTHGASAGSVTVSYSKRHLGRPLEVPWTP